MPNLQETERDLRVALDGVLTEMTDLETHVTTLMSQLDTSDITGARETATKIETHLTGLRASTTNIPPVA